MDYSLEYYKVFYYVGKLGSVTAAADKLNISQPAVSQAIKNLESYLGGKVFNRTPKGAKLTPEGEVLFSYISKGYEYMTLGEEKFFDLLNLETGEVRIGASDMTLKFYLLPHIEKFHNLFPKVRVKVSNAPTPETIESLKSGIIDFGVISEPVLDAKGLHISPVSEITDVFIGGARFSQLKNKKVMLSELEDLPIICLEDITSTRHYVDEFLANNNVHLQPEFELATSELIVEFTERNLGIGSVVRDFAKQQLESGKLFEIELEHAIPSRHICVATSDRPSMSPAGKRLIDLLI